MRDRMRRALLLRPRATAASGPAATEIIRPDGVFGSQTGTVTGAGSVNAALSDQSDSSYVTDADAGGYDRILAHCTLGNLTLAAGRQIASVTISVRSELTSGTPTGLTYVQPANVTPTPANRTFTPPASVGDITSASFSKSGGGNWTESEVNAMRALVDINANGAETIAARLYEVWVTVTYA